MSSLLLLLLWAVPALLVMTAFAASVAWVWRDANRRGQPGFIVAVLVVFLFWPLSLIVWLLARPAVPAAPTVPDGTATPARSGRGCLWAALAAAIIVLLPIIVLGILIPLFFLRAPAVHDRDRIKCMNNVKQLAAMYTVYSRNHAGTPPRSFEDLRQYGSVDKLSRCPAAGKDGPPSYRLYPGSNATDLIIIEKPGNHGLKGDPSNQGCHIAFGDGHVEWTAWRPVSTRAVITAIEKQLPPGLAQYAPDLAPVCVKEVRQVTYDAAANRYDAQVLWTTKGQRRLSDFSLVPVPSSAVQTTGAGKYIGRFPLQGLKPDPQGQLFLSITVDELMDGTTARKELP